MKTELNNLKTEEIQALSDLHLEIKIMEGTIKVSKTLALLPYYDPSIHMFQDFKKSLKRTLSEEKTKLQALKMAYNDKINNLTKY